MSPQPFLFITQGNSISEEGMQVNKENMYMRINKQYVTPLKLLNIDKIM